MLCTFKGLWSTSLDRWKHLIVWIILIKTTLRNSPNSNSYNWPGRRKNSDWSLITERRSTSVTKCSLYKMWTLSQVLQVHDCLKIKDRLKSSKCLRHTYLTLLNGQICSKSLRIISIMNKMKILNCHCNLRKAKLWTFLIFESWVRFNLKTYWPLHKSPKMCKILLFWSATL